MVRRNKSPDKKEESLMGEFLKDNPINEAND